MTPSRYTLTLIDTSGIQEYIFGSNRLRENIGASQQVHAATTSAVVQAIHTALGEQEPRDLADLSSEPRLEANPNCRCEIIYVGGGNALLLCRTRDDARAIVRELSLHLHIHAPGLQFAAAHLDFDWEQDRLGDQADTPGVMTCLSAQAARTQRPPAAPLYGLGVTLECVSTGLPATGPEREPPSSEQLQPRLLSASTHGKLAARADADTRLKDLLGSDVLDLYAIPTEVDSMGRSREEQSYLAVVHIDGNGMGARFRTAGQASGTNRDTIQAMRALSQQINDASRSALQQTIAALRDFLVADAPHNPAWASDRDVLLHSLDRACADGNERPYLPFRPLVFGGDDVTFVCDGRLGLALAAFFLHAFEQATATLPGGRAHACAGVAIVKSRFPFARAYNLAEDLCANAKKALRAANLTDDHSALDWHIAASGRSDEISVIRQRAYRSAAGESLTARPVLFAAANQAPAAWSFGTWPRLQQTVATLNYDEDWRARRNKVLALREVLRQGPAAVEQFKVRYGLTEQSHADPALLFADPALLFDAIEAMEFLLPLVPPDVASEAVCG